jgi:hypothetical protein
MAIVKSIELTNDELIPRVRNIPRDAEAAHRIATFTFFPSGEAAGSTVRFGMLRKGWRLQGMRFSVPTSIGAAGATMSLGIAGAVAKYMAATLLDSGANDKDLNCNDTSVFFYGEVLAADVELIGTTAGGALLTSTVNKLIVQVRYIWN